MILTTTSSMEGKRIVGYLWIVSGESIIGTNIFKDLFAGVRHREWKVGGLRRGNCQSAGPGADRNASPR